MAGWDVEPLSDEELFQAYRSSLDSAAQNYGPPSPEYFLHVILQRETAKSQRNVENQTETIRRLTWAILALTAVNVVAAVVSVFS